MESSFGELSVESEIVESEESLPGMGSWPNLNLSGLSIIGLLSLGSLSVSEKFSPGVGELCLELPEEWLVCREVPSTMVQT